MTKTKVIGIRVTEDQETAINRAAIEAGMKAGEFVRDAALQIAKAPMAAKAIRKPMTIVEHTPQGDRTTVIERTATGMTRCGECGARL